MTMSERCSKCFAIVDSSAEFCPRCGEPYVSAAEAQRQGQRCPSCGHANTTGARFCASCGARLQPEEQPEAAAQGTANQSEDPWAPPPSERATSAGQQPCPRCGAPRQFGASQCYQCGLPFGHTGFTPGIPAAVSMQGKPAGFWIRVGAWIIDIIILVIIYLVPYMIWLFVSGSLDTWDEGEDLPTPAWSFVFEYIIPIVYWITFHALYGATPGKRALNIYVLNENGEKQIGFVRAIIRYIGTIVSGFILLIGYIMVGFREDKRALHDLIATTYPTQITRR